MALKVITHPSCEAHDMGEFHPESPARYYTSVKKIKSALKDIVWLEAPLASEAELSQAHAPDYVQHVFQSAPSSGFYDLDADTRMNPQTLTAARHASGSGLLAVDEILQNPDQPIFCLVRPPGHHAEYAQAMGFCFFNSIAVTALYALQQPAINKVVIVDFDVHHGNGTQAILGENQDVMFCSSYQHPFYPNRYNDFDNQRICHAQLPAGSGSSEFRAAVTPWFEKIVQFKPELILISAGFDAHDADPLGQLHLLEEDYVWITQKIVECAHQLGHQNIISMLEGGYNLEALASSVLAHVTTLHEVRLKGAS